MIKTWWIKPEQLDADQKKVITLSKDKSFLINGPPGSGKTNLLLLRANYLSKAGLPDLKILVFTRTLQEYLAKGASNYAFSAEKIMTSTRWMLSILNDFGINIVLSEDFDERRQHLLNEVQSIVDKEGIENYHEVILLDEAQDYLPEEIILFRRMSRKIFAVADSRQKIYLGNDPLNALESNIDEIFKLRYHYRNGLKICKLADGIAKKSTKYVLLSPTSNYDERTNPSSIDLNKCTTLEDQCNLILERLDSQIKAYPKEFIGIICPRREELQRIIEIFSNSCFNSKIQLVGDEDYIPFDINRPIIISTLHSAKGLEFRALHIAGFNYIKKFGQQRNIAYMAVTRAKTLLSIYHSRAIFSSCRKIGFELSYGNMVLWGGDCAGNAE